MWVCMSWCSCGHQPTTHRRKFSLSSLWVPGKSGSLAWQQMPLPACWVILLLPQTYLLKTLTLACVVVPKDLWHYVAQLSPVSRSSAVVHLWVGSRSRLKNALQEQNPRKWCSVVGIARASVPRNGKRPEKEGVSEVRVSSWFVG